MEKLLKMFDNTPIYWGAFIGGAIASTWQCLMVFGFRVQLIDISWAAVFSDILKVVPATLVGGLVGGFMTAFGKKLADRAYNKIFNDKKSKDNGNNSNPD